MFQNLYISVQLWPISCYLNLTRTHCSHRLGANFMMHFTEISNWNYRTVFDFEWIVWRREMLSEFIFMAAIFMNQIKFVIPNFQNDMQFCWIVLSTSRSPFRWPSHTIPAESLDLRAFTLVFLSYSDLILAPCKKRSEPSFILLSGNFHLHKKS